MRPQKGSAHTPAAPRLDLVLDCITTRSARLGPLRCVCAVFLALKEKGRNDDDDTLFTAATTKNIVSLLC